MLVTLSGIMILVKPLQFSKAEKSMLVTLSGIVMLSRDEQYKSALKLEPLLLINYLVDEIILYNDRIEIRFTSPITKSPDNCQGFLLYSNSTTISCYDKITGIFVNEPFYCIVKL